MGSHSTLDIAVIGTGIAGAACAHALSSAGHGVHVFEKSRGPGGRLATRRVEWVDACGQACTTRLDHGAVGITAGSSDFQAFVDRAVGAGWLAEWMPVLDPQGLPPEDDAALYLPVPSMPEICRHLLGGATASWSFAVDRLHRSPFGWQVEAAGVRHAKPFDAVLLALPPAQAAPLLGPHRTDWSRHAALAQMQPCWTLMGVADACAEAPDAVVPWDLTRPRDGLLASVLRSDSRPGRERVAGQAHWVAHARPGWSRQNLEQPAAWVQAQMQAALAECVGRPVHWLHSTVQRWRYAMPQAPGGAPSDTCWWDASQGLGACGDFLGGRGVEGAWLSAQALATALLHSVALVPDSPVDNLAHAPDCRTAA